MLRKKRVSAISAMLAAMLLLMLTLVGCGGKDAAAEEPAAPAASVEPAPVEPAPDEPVQDDEPGEAAQPAEPDESVEEPEEPEAEDDGERQDGDRFEAVIELEGMEETVKYEHVRNEAIGFELDYEYELLERQSGADAERFVSLYDDPEAPVNYLELRYEANDAETVAAAVRAALAEDFGSISAAPSYYVNAGWCVQIDASDANGVRLPRGTLQTVYIFFTDEGCLVVTSHYTVESAEGFGARFDAMLQTLSLIEG